MKKIVYIYVCTLSLNKTCELKSKAFDLFFAQSLLELSPFAVKVMFWSCVNQSDYQKFYIQFWLWPGLTDYFRKCKNMEYENSGPSGTLNVSFIIHLY